MKRQILFLLFFAFLAVLAAGCPAPCDVQREELDAIHGDAAPLVEALENYRAERGIYPPTLVELAPQYLSSPPEKLGGRRFSYYRESEDKYRLRLASRNGGTYSGGCTYSEIEEQWKRLPRAN